MESVVLRRIWTGVSITLLTLALPTIGVAGAAHGAASANAAGERARDEISVDGTVEQVELEGGFWGVIGDDGRRYDVVNLPKEFQQQGLRVRLAGRVRPDRISFHMWGVVVEVISIERLGMTRD